MAKATQTTSDATDKAIEMQEKQMKNQAKLAEANAKAMDEQARLELFKSTHEMSAKSTKACGESLKGLA